MVIDFNGAALLLPRNDSLGDFFNFINTEKLQIFEIYYQLLNIILGKHLKLISFENL